MVTEYQYPKLVCPCCRKETRAALRPEHEIGERLTGVIGYLIVVRKMTRRDVHATLRDLFGLEISVGSVLKAWEETSEAVQVPYEELEQALPAETVVNSDETGSRTNGDKRWVWVLCSPRGRHADSFVGFQGERRGATRAQQADDFVEIGGFNLSQPLLTQHIVERFATGKWIGEAVGFAVAYQPQLNAARCLHVDTLKIRPTQIGGCDCNSLAWIDAGRCGVVRERFQLRRQASVRRTVRADLSC